jgi:hypothetical protein
MRMRGAVPALLDANQPVPALPACDWRAPVWHPEVVCDRSRPVPAVLSDRMPTLSDKTYDRTALCT